MPSIEIERTARIASYFWYLFRALEHQATCGLVKINYVPAKENRPYELAMWVDDMPIVVDVRDTHHLPTELAAEVEAELVVKSSYSSEFWNNYSDEMERETGLTTSEEDWRLVESTKIGTFAFGRSLDFPIATDEIAWHKDTTVTPFCSVAAISGAGWGWRQTHNRLRLLELVSDVRPDSNVFWCRSERCHEPDQVPHYTKRANRFAIGHVVNSVLTDRKRYMRFLRSGRFGLNMPGFNLSPPFRLVDGVLAGTPCISTKIWADAYLDFPCEKLDICAYTGRGDWSEAKSKLEEILSMGDAERQKLIALQKQWYVDHLTPDGMFAQLRLAGVPL